ncbi:hypothetical protein [Ligilactobacillus pobuzihii]|nr:hypothetical protein [Ligilactobacillus pobuzihii]GEN48923.1 hypothetical protein LPO01_17150 [Ligilactobacillus pobuzihii]
MTKIIKQRQKGFTTVDNSVVRDERLSWKARGIFFYLWSQSDEWDYFTNEVVRHSPDGLTALRTGLKELEKYGYLARKRTRNEKGQISTSDWIISEKPYVEKPRIENQHVDNRTLRTTNLKNKQPEEILTKEHSAFGNAPHAFEKEFQEVWDQYPNKKGKKEAFNHYKAWRKKSVKNTNEYLLERLSLYKKHLAANSWKQPMNGATWFNGRFDDQLEVPQEQGEVWYE